MSSNTEAWLKLAVDASALVAKTLRNSDAKTIDREPTRDLKLRADRLAEEAILRTLSAHSNFSILSEEAGELPKEASDYRWIVDPLDGTINFFRGIPMYATSIALWQGTRPILGVVRDLTNGEVFSGIVGQGCQLNDKPVTVSRIDQKIKGILVTGLPAASDFSDAAVKNLVGQIQGFKKVRLIGSAALSLAYVAAGRADVYQEARIRWWDVAAGIALVQAAGGAVEYSFVDQPQFILNVTASNGIL